MRDQEVTAEDMGMSSLETLSLFVAAIEASTRSNKVRHVDSIVRSASSQDACGAHIWRIAPMLRIVL